MNACVWMLCLVITLDKTVLLWLWGKKKNMLHIWKEKKENRRKKKWEEAIMLYIRCLLSASVEERIKKKGR